MNTTANRNLVILFSLIFSVGISVLCLWYSLEKNSLLLYVMMVFGYTFLAFHPRYKALFASSAFFRGVIYIFLATYVVLTIKYILS